MRLKRRAIVGGEEDNVTSLFGYAKEFADRAGGIGDVLDELVADDDVKTIGLKTGGACVAVKQPLVPGPVKPERVNARRADRQAIDIVVDTPCVLPALQGRRNERTAAAA